MVGTAFRNQPFGKIASTGRSRLWSGLVGTSVGAFSPLSIRKLLTALLVLAFIFGTIACGPAAHEWLEGKPAATVQTLGAATNAPVDDKAPAKKTVAGLCTGHCISHTLTLPAFFAQAIVPFAHRAVWSVLEDQWLQAARPALLERPPRA
ncbi:hypothetical protein [Caulobacter henricii]|uniref:Uncharacterized protein n=1 Tax=Caulobacter henricii TaxID=69395 RepID=A0A0P0P521_9CAUL|nr:hypothetical protein [Caulobacter henricii]ALL15473.1 hypothetical protein AQ619_18485 [Caulobacter henricii]